MSQNVQRETCLKCQRVITTCYCHVLKPQDSIHHYIILQHPSERRHPLGTAYMAHRGLKNSTLLIGEDFMENEQLKALILKRKTYLLYPYEYAIEIQTIQNELKDRQVNFVILDGTWKKARKILHLNTFLQELPMVKINPLNKSNYKIRKQPSDKGLSTIESIAEVFAQLENQSIDNLMAPFHFVIEKQIEIMGQDVFEKYYSKS